MSARHKIRCAIYTRKSSEEGLDQEFNSLDAQHEACAAFIASQRHEGWTLVPARYDDGGHSGGTLERPALQRLLAEVDAGRINMVVVYKIDRLTRSLADFARMVERLEQASCSFVSVTQAFNTSSSMGRLTLNVLLSFAQFEREVTAERIRDKIAASKKKGLWMGSLPPLGYDPHPDKTRRELVVNTAEAETVRRLFALYAHCKCLNAVTREAERIGLRSKRRVFASGRVQGGTLMSRGQIHRILTNPVYIGLIRHKDRTWPGLHAPIIEQELWDEVQALLQAASAKKRGAPAGLTSDGAAPLKGKFRDETGDRLTPSHTKRRGRILRYYISNRLISGGPDPAAWRLPAKAFEAAVTQAITGHLKLHADRHTALLWADAAAAQSACLKMHNLARRIRNEGVGLAASLIATGAIARGRITINLDEGALGKATGLEKAALAPGFLCIRTPFTCRRRGVEMKIIAGEHASFPDQTLIRALRNAHKWSAALKAGTPLREIARTDGFSERYIARIIPLACLSPKIQAAIIDGTQPVGLTLERLVQYRLPLGWHAQENLLGVAHPAIP